MTDRKYDTLDPDVNLFIDRAIWFGKEQKMTVCQFLDWFTGYLTVDDPEFIKKALPFFHPEHKRAEEILCSLLRIDFRRKQKIRKISSSITRNTDWPRTYAKAFPLIPQKYHHIETRQVPNNILFGILAAIARSWAGIARNLIELVQTNDKGGLALPKQDLSIRAGKLEHAVRLIEQRGIQPHSKPLSTQYRQVIMRILNPTDQKLFFNSLNYWNSYGLGDVVNNMAALIPKLTSRDETTNLAGLFEVSCNLSIVHTAVKNDWQLNDVRSRFANKKNIYTFHLKKGDQNFILGKGNPKNLFNKSPYATNEQSDRMLALRKLAEFSGSGYEPDIVMGFYKNGQEDQPLVLFGDAKRYEKSDIAGAYKETVASTMIAYGHWGGLKIKTDADWGTAFVCPVNPFFTLFYVKENGSSSVRPRNQRGQNDQPIPPVLAIELEYMEGDSEELNLWFSDIEEQVLEYFNQ